MPTTEPIAAARAARDLPALERSIIDCVACPRLVAWREESARDKVARFRDETYWGRPVPGFGDPEARILLVGLAPAAHGGNRTGRVFTGDASGDFLWRALHAVGLADRPVEPARRRRPRRSPAVRVVAAVRCAPPANKPHARRAGDTVAPYLVRELELLDGLRVIVALGAYRLGRDPAVPRGASVTRLPAPKPAVRARRRGRASGRTRWSGPTTRASRTRSPGA